MSRKPVSLTIAAAIVSLLQVGFLVGAESGQFVHPYHVSLTEIAWNAESGNLEIAMKVWPADLEKGLAQHLGRPVDLDDELELDRKLSEYVATRFSVRQQDRELPVRWAGHEKNLKEAWLYFEVVSPKPELSLEMGQSLFHELNEDQINYVHVQFGRGLVSRFQFTIDQPEQTVEWRAAAGDR